MKNKTKYQICAVFSAVLMSASLVLLMPLQRTSAEESFQREEIDTESIYKFIFDIKSGNLDGAERAALAMPLTGGGARLVHRLLTHIRKNELTEEEDLLISTIAKEDDVYNAVAEIEYAASKEIKTIAENNERTESEARKAVMSILGNGIRLTARKEAPSENIICLGAANMYVEVDKREMFIVHLNYDCTPGERKMTEAQCEEKAGRFVLRNMPRRYSATRPAVQYVCENGGCDCFIVTLGEKRTWVKVRCDTGSIVLFCGYGTEM